LEDQFEKEYFNQDKEKMNEEMNAENVYDNRIDIETKILH
jgi:hypothetical protein